MFCSLPGTHFYHFGIPFGVTFASLGPLLEHFWVHVSNNGAKGAPRGATTKIVSLIWTHLGGHFSDIFVIWVKQTHT